MEMRHSAENVATTSPLPPVKSAHSPASQASVASQEDYEYCRQVMRTASKNYSFAGRFLPREKLPHVEALYALMRVGDDRVDVSHSGFKSPGTAIEDWEQTYWRAFDTGMSSHPVMRAYLDTSRQFGIPKETIAPYFRAMKEDLSITRFPTFDHLVHYMEGSALTVGRAMTYLLGTQPPYSIADALPGADSLSIAMQLSNFWRDIAQDWEMNRVYLPQEDLLRFAVTEADLASKAVTPNLIDLLEFQLERTEHYYDQARISVKMLASGQWGVMSALEIYRSILSSIRSNGYDIFNQRAGANTLQKTGLVWRAYRQVRGT